MSSAQISLRMKPRERPSRRQLRCRQSLASHPLRSGARRKSGRPHPCGRQCWPFVASMPRCGTVGRAAAAHRSGARAPAANALQPKRVSLPSPLAHLLSGFGRQRQTRLASRGPAGSRPAHSRRSLAIHGSLPLLSSGIHARGRYAISAASSRSIPQASCLRAGVHCHPCTR